MYMPSSAKRKRKQADSSADAAIGSSYQALPPAWAASPSRLALEPGQVIYFGGRAEVQCKSGAVYIQGTHLESARPGVCLCADLEAGGLLPIQALPSDTQVPRAPGSCCLAFSPVTDAEGDGKDNPGSSWSVYGKIDSQAAVLIMPEWAEAASEISTAMHEASAGLRGHATAAVCGSKGAGKSTFGRLLLNALLNVCAEVAWLDTDCGQPEFTVPGLVSLTYVRQPVYGMPHMHPLTPARAHYIGHLSPEWDPQRYGSAIADLARFHAKHSSAVPLVVNTCGWIKGLGEDVLADVLRCTRPSHVVTLQTPTPRRNVPQGQFWLTGDSTAGPLAPPAAAQQAAAVIQLPAVQSQGPAGSSPAGPKKMTATQSRNLAWLNFVRMCCGLPLHRSKWVTEPVAEAAEALTWYTPFAVGLDSVRLEFLHTAVPEHLAGAVLNGALVGLCCEDAQHGAATAECLGVGLVRACDAAEGLLYILTPLRLNALQRVNLLQVGRLDLPPELLQSGPIVSPYLSSWSISTVGTGAGAIKSRNNLQRAAQTA